MRGRRGGSIHTYLRLHPELRAKVDGPKTGKEPAVTGQRHPALQGFDETDIIPYGGMLQPLRVDAGAATLLTLVPEFPCIPPKPRGCAKAIAVSRASLSVKPQEAVAWRTSLPISIAGTSAN